jgi:hypothetical protein
MPVIQLLPTENQIRATLQEALGTKSDPSNLKNLLNDAGLSPAELLDSLGSLSRCAESDAIKLRAIELGAKLNGLLSEDTIKSVPVVNIIISDQSFSGVNPILIPRAEGGPVLT